ncbi:MAG: DUF4440 domain-containing protein [Bacteriovoracaceae bacterium]|nr:DUF4440 domain-containing protein [Bacteroidota bacterium]
MKPQLLILLLLVMIHPVFPQSTIDVPTDTQQIFKILQMQVDGWNNGNIEAFMQGYAQTDSLRFASEGSVSYGWKNMLDRYRKSYPTRTTMGTLIFSGITVDFVSTEAALAFGTWKLHREKDEPWGLFTLIFKKIKGEWRIVHDHTSSGK